MRLYVCAFSLQLSVFMIASSTICNATASGAVYMYTASGAVYMYTASGAVYMYTASGAVYIAFHNLKRSDG
jgi:hypothetical protein